MAVSRRGRLIFLVAVIVLALAWVVTNGLAGSLVYFRTPTELLGLGDSAIGERIRLGGLVQDGSVERLDSTVTFVLTDGTSEVTVVNTGGVPALFDDGKGVLVEGVYGDDQVFHADTVLVKHEDSYRPPGPGETLNTADLEGS